MIKRLIKFIMSGCKCNNCQAVLNDATLCARNGERWYEVKTEIIKALAIKYGDGHEKKTI